VSTDTSAESGSRDARQGRRDARLRGRLELLSRLVPRIASSLDLPSVLQDVVDAACDLTEARYGALAVFDASNKVEQFFTHGLSREERERIGDLPKGRGILGLLQRLQTPMRLRDVAEHPDSVGFPPNHPPMKTFLGVPIRDGDRVLGNLYLTEKAGGEEFTEGDQHFVALLAVQAATAVLNARRLLAEQAAQDELRLQAEVIQQVHDAVVATDPDGYVTSWNTGAERLFGYPAAEALGRQISFVYPEDQQQFLQEQVIGPLRKKGTHQIEVRMRRKSGEDFHAHLSLSLLRDRRGAVTGMIGFSMDITERKQAEAKLAASVRQQRTVAALGQFALVTAAISELMDRTVAIVSETLDVEFCQVLELLPDRSGLVLRAGVGWKPGYVGEAVVAADADSQAGYTLASDQPVVVEDLRAEKRFHGSPLLVDHGVVSGVSVVILGEEGPFGVLGVHTATARRFTEDDVHFVQAVANTLAAAVERKQVEESLRENEERFRQLAENIREVFWMTTADGSQVIYASPTYEEIWGRSRRSLYDHPEEWVDAVHQEDRERVVAAYGADNLAAGGLDEEYRIVRPDGGLRWIRDRGFPIRDQQGDVYRIVGIAEDVTERKETEETLRRQAELLDLAHDAIFVRDWRSKAIRYWSRGAEVMYGWSPAEALGKVSAGLLATEFPRPLAEIEAQLVRWGRWEGELVQKRRDGSAIVVDSRWALQRDDRGQPVAILQIGSDVTERKRAHETIEQERLLALVNTSPVGIFVADSSGNVLVTNREAERILGISRDSEYDLDDYERAVVMRRPDGSPLPPEGSPLRRALNNGETVRAEEISLHLPDGRTVVTLVNATPFYGAHGEITGAIAAIQDMTPLEELEKLRGEFLGMVSHELRAPLTAIKGSASLAMARGGQLDAEQTRELFETIDEQADELAELVGNLLDITRIEAGVLSVNPAPLNLGAVVEEARSTFASGGAGQEVRLELPEDLPVVKADRHRTVQVLINLLNNAASVSPEGAPITVSAQHDGQFVVVRVSDRGPGIPKEKLTQLFKKFAQLQEKSARLSGTGLGLAICKGIAEAQGGRIWADSPGEGLGATFSFTLPLAAQPAAAPSPVHEDATPALRITRAPKRARVLAVDDDLRMLKYLRRALGDAGYEAVVTDDPEQVATLLETEEPDLILLDIVLPGTSGFDLLEGIRQFSAVPVIFLSGRDQEEDVVRGLELGADDYICKPFSPSELLARIDAALRRKAAPDTAAARRFVAGDLSIDFAERSVTVAGRPVRLSATEYKLLYELATHGGRVLTHDQLLQRAWGEEYSGATDLLRSSIRHLRRKLGDDARHPRYIMTEPQVGYRMPKSEAR
jgi:PAS domain S-box-containing protein